MTARCFADTNLFLYAGSKDPADAEKKKIARQLISLEDIGVASGSKIAFQVSLWDRDLPLAAVPQQGWIEFSTRNPRDWPL